MGISLTILSKVDFPELSLLFVLNVDGCHDDGYFLDALN